jgi:hypothetical protein
MKSIMIYGYDRCGTTTLMHCLAKDRIILGEFLYEDWFNHHFVESIVPVNESVRKFKISNTSALNSIIQSNSIIAKCHLHWAKPEYFDFNGAKIFIHRKDIVDAQLSRQLALHTNIWNSHKIPTINPVILDVDEFIIGMVQRVDTTYLDQPMDYVLDYDNHLPMLIEDSGYSKLVNSNKKLYTDKSKLILNYDELMKTAEQFIHDIDIINNAIKYTNIDNDLEYKKWIETDYVDFYGLHR